MKLLGRIALGILLFLGAVVVGVYVDGAIQPVEHSTTIKGVVNAPPAKVFAIITNVADGASWRRQVKAVTVLPSDKGRDHWVEDLGHGQTMNFLATRTDPVDASGVARRDVLLSDPNASYGGAWTYLLAPGDTPNQTTLSITEAGFIKPPVYRFVMRHVMGMTANLDQYMADIKAAAAK